LSAFNTKPIRESRYPVMVARKMIKKPIKLKMLPNQNQPLSTGRIFYIKQ